MPRKSSTLFCVRCRRRLPRDEFDVNPGSNDYHERYSRCRTCRSQSKARSIELVPNPADPTGQTLLVPLSQGMFAVIDREDAPIVAPFQWTLMRSSHTCYAHRLEQSETGRKQLYLHQAIMGRKMVDHRDGDGLNCIRSNMRSADSRLNSHNVVRDHTSRFRGVSWDSTRRKWRAQIKIAGKSVGLGRFDSEEAAATAYRVAEIAEYGENVR